MRSSNSMKFSFVLAIKSVLGMNLSLFCEWILFTGMWFPKTFKGNTLSRITIVGIIIARVESIPI